MRCVAKVFRAYGDEGSLRTIAWYTPEGGAISVTLRKEDGDAPVAVLSVKDEGLGIPEADLARVFDRFSRGSNVVGGIAGTGIGLASARQIVEEHGGTISVESQVGLGTEVTVRLPLELDLEQGDSMPGGSEADGKVVEVTNPGG